MNGLPGDGVSLEQERNMTMKNNKIGQTKDDNMILESVIADQLNIRGLLVALADRQQTIRNYLFACNDSQTKTNVNSLLLELNHSDDSISAIISCIQQFNDDDLKMLNKLSIKDSCN